MKHFAAGDKGTLHSQVGGEASSYADTIYEYSRANAHEVYPQKRRRKTKKRRVIIAVLASLLSIFLVIAGALAIYVNILQNRLSGNGLISESLAGLLTERKAPQDPFYVLLLGTDGRPGETNYRSDTIILARIDPQDKQVTLVSIPRDTPVEIPGHGRQKINAAHTFGGPSQAVSSVSQFCGVPITHYLEVSFEGFSTLVDALGGVEVDVPVKIDDKDAGGLLIQPGLQTLNGEQALNFVRSRKFRDGDFSRMRHQRLFIQALVHKVLNESNPAEMAATLDSLSKMVLTDMSVKEILELMKDFQGMDPANMKTAVVPSDSQTIGGVAYVVPNLEAWKEMMRRVDAGLDPNESDEEQAIHASEANKRHEQLSLSSSPENKNLTVAIKNGARIKGAGGTLSNLIKGANYTVSGVTDIDKKLYEESIIMYRGEKSQRAAERLAQELKINKVQKDDSSVSYKGDILILIGTDWLKTR